METHEVVPDVIDVAPTATIKVITSTLSASNRGLISVNKIEYDSGVSADNGNELTPTQVQNEPIKIEWPVEDGALYTLCMTGEFALESYNYQ